MEFRQLGGSGLKVPVLTLGTGTFGGNTNEFFKSWGASDVAEAKRLVARGNEGGPLEIGGGAARKRKGRPALPVARPAKTA